MNRMLLTNPRVAQSLGSFAADVENVMDRFFGERSDVSTGASFAPHLDIAETDQAYELTMDVPGVKAEDVEIEAKEGYLTISGSRRSVSEQQERQYHRVERASGAFSRTIVLPRGIDHERIEASCQDGVLVVTLPKAESNQPRRIRVQAGAPAAERAVLSDRSEKNQGRPEALSKGSEAEQQGKSRQGKAEHDRSKPHAAESRDGAGV